jgi:hypothetical protein
METTIMNFIVLGAVAGFVGGIINMFLWRQTLRNKKIFGIKLQQGFSEVLKESFDPALQQPGLGKLDKIQENIIKLFDDFMANKLTQKMPVLSMFIDEQLISEIRVIFHAEMEESLPKLLEEKLNFTDKSSDISLILQSSIDKIIKKYTRQALFYLLIGVIGGGVVGFLFAIII